MQFRFKLGEGGGRAPSTHLYHELYKLKTGSLIISSRSADLKQLLDMGLDVDPKDNIRVDLTWKGKQEFSTTAIGRTVDEAIENAISCFYMVYPSGKFPQGE